MELSFHVSQQDILIFTHSSDIIKSLLGGQGRGWGLHYGQLLGHMLRTIHTVIHTYSTFKVVYCSSVYL